ncbi:MAG: ferredoxin--NADP reductase [Gammaproteobacteria bacterium]
MTTQKAVLRGRESIAEGTMAFHFEKPAGFSFKPGQAIDLILADPPSADPASARHAFSVVSAPSENVVTIATRMRGSGFKNALAALPVGSPVELDGPFGSLTLHSNRARPAVFIAGGIGITPFMSILRQAAHDQLSQRFVLVYSNHRPEAAAFLEELQRIEREWRNFRFVPVMTQLNGRIEREMITRVKDEASTAMYYVTGSPAMVAGIRQLLANAAIDDDDVRSEEFYGY